MGTGMSMSTKSARTRRTRRRIRGIGRMTEEGYEDYDFGGLKGIRRELAAATLTSYRPPRAV